MMLASQKAQIANELKIIDEYERTTHIWKFQLTSWLKVNFHFLDDISHYNILMATQP